MSCDVLDIFRLSDHIKLGKNCHCLQPNRKRPEHPVQSEVPVEEESEDY